MNNLKTLALGVAITAFSLGTAGAVMSAEYWRWKDADGIVHYGSTPPKGVDAEKVKTYGGVSSSSNHSSSGAQNGTDSDNETKPEVELTPEMKARRDARCAEEKERLAVFSKPGRIRMTQPDGSTKYMTEQEIQQEMAISKQVIAESCN